MNVENILDKEIDLVAENLDNRILVCRIELTTKELRSILYSLSRTSCSGEELTISMQLENEIERALHAEIEYPSSGRKDYKIPLLKRVCRKVKRFFLKMKYSSFYHAPMYRKLFYVRYSDGKKSINMYYRTAKDYASIFGGEVMDAF